MAVAWKIECRVMMRTGWVSSFLVLISTMSFGDVMSCVAFLDKRGIYPSPSTLDSGALDGIFILPQT